MGTKYAIGETFTSKYGTAVITQDSGLGKQNVRIRWQDEFEHEHVVKTTNLKNGKVLNPYFPINRGVGYIGSGDYTPVKNKREHSVWSSMLDRAYDAGYKEWKPSYADVFVRDGWLNFQSFAEWCNLQPGFFEPDYHLDKDLLVPGNKEYGPTFCRFVPAYVNTVLSASGGIRGEWPIGVHKIKGSKINPYSAQIKSSSRTPRYLGLHPTPSKAHQAWQLAKANQIEQTISEYSEEKVFDTGIADALMYRVWKLRTDAAMGIETITL